MTVNVLLHVRAFAAPVTFHELIREAIEQYDAFGAVGGHVRYPPAHRESSARISSGRLRAWKSRLAPGRPLDAQDAGRLGRGQLFEGIQ